MGDASTSVLSRRAGRLYAPSRSCVRPPALELRKRQRGRSAMDGQLDVFECIEIAQAEADCDDCPDPALCQAEGCMASGQTLDAELYPCWDST